jgi:hypothetical protein
MVEGGPERFFRVSQPTADGGKPFAIATVTLSP